MGDTRDQDWTTLEEYLISNGFNYDGTTTGNKIAKSMVSRSGWVSSTTTGYVGNNQAINNSSGFNALPVGYRETAPDIVLNFIEQGVKTTFWTSEVYPLDTSR